MKHIFFLFLFFATTALSQTDAGLIGYYSFDNDNLNEESGNGQNGLMNGSITPTFECGVQGRALSFNGTTDQLLLFGYGNTLDINDFTLSFYLQPRPTLSPQIVLAKRELCNNQHALGLQYTPSVDGIDYLISENPSKSLLFKEFFNTDRCWQHLVLVRQDDVISLYINGELVRQENTVTRIDIENTAELTFGGGPCLLPTTTPFKGALDEVRIYNRALNTSDVESLYLAPHEITNQRDTLLFLGSSMQIRSNEACANTFFWSPTEGVDDVTSSMPMITPTETAFYTLEFDMGTCTARDSILIKVINTEDLDCNEVFLPSAFTPNGDGRNDSYGLSNPYAIEEMVSFEIFDQWGGRVFYSTDAFGRWDGTKGGDELNPGVLLYRVHYRCSGELHTQTGSVTLLR